jgi:hypothetical protein
MFDEQQALISSAEENVFGRHKQRWEIRLHVSWRTLGWQEEVGKNIKQVVAERRWLDTAPHNSKQNCTYHWRNQAVKFLHSTTSNQLNTSAQKQNLHRPA